jgi:hypothetical protein
VKIRDGWRVVVVAFFLERPMLRSLFAAFFIAFATCSPALAVTPKPYVITNDPGGVIDEFIEKYRTLRETNAKIIVDGPCYSACTLVLALVPKENVCITPYAIFGFHSASLGMTGVFSKTGTGHVWFQYPRALREWLKTNGWNGDEHPELLFMDNEDAAQLLQRCAE